MLAANVGFIKLVNYLVDKGASVHAVSSAVFTVRYLLLYIYYCYYSYEYLLLLLLLFELLQFDTKINCAVEWRYCFDESC